MNKLVIPLIIIFLLASFVFLAATERKQESLENQNFWVVYFENPQENGLNFAIDNRNDSENFHWEATANGEKFQEGNLQIQKGEKKTVPLKSEKAGKIEIKVKNGEENQLIYKII